MTSIACELAMRETIQKLLALQNHDRLISEATADWESIGPRREAVKAQALHAQQKLEKEKFRLRAAEARRKELELEVESKKSLAQRYAQQQLETRNNEEYRALANQIRTVEEDVSRLDDLQLQSMEEIDAARKELTEFEKNFQASIESFKQHYITICLTVDKIWAIFVNNIGVEEVQCLVLNPNKSELKAAFENGALWSNKVFDEKGNTIKTLLKTEFDKCDALTQAEFANLIKVDKNADQMAKRLVEGKYLVEQQMYKFKQAAMRR